MAINRVNLEDVISEAKAALEAGNADKAIALCHHIFKFYPRCLEASRMLGEAYTEQRLFAEAEQLFVFVLSADPQDVLGYVDRGFIAYEQGRLDDAILYCERALELDPSIEQLREELLRLYRERLSGARPQIRMTKVGLANARLRDGLYGQAIEEYTTVLRQTPNRLDVQVGLMEAFWRNRDYNRAEQMAQELIENNAYLVKANLILWHIYGVRRNQDKAADYLERAHALDPLSLLAERLFEDSTGSNEAMNYISMLGVPAIPRPDSVQIALEAERQKNLVPEWATGRQETDVVLGLRPDLPSATEEDNNLGLDLFALLSDTERHVAQQQEEEIAHQQEQPATPPSQESLNSLDELRQITQSGENDSFNLFEEVETPGAPSFSLPVKPASEPTPAAPGAFDLDFSLAKDGDLSLFEEVEPADQSAQTQAAPQPFTFEPDFAASAARDSDNSEIVPFAFDEDANPPEFLQDIPPFFFDDESATEAKSGEVKPFSLEESGQDSAALPLEPFNLDEALTSSSEEVSAPLGAPITQPGHDEIEDLEATDIPLPLEQVTEPFNWADAPEWFSSSNEPEASPVTNLEANRMEPVQPDEGPGLPLYSEPEPQPILVPTPTPTSTIPSESPDAPQEESGSGQDDTGDTADQPAIEPPGLPETAPGAEPDQPLPMFETEAGSYPEPAYSSAANAVPSWENSFDQAEPGSFAGFAATGQAPGLAPELAQTPEPAPVYREPFAFYKRDEQGPIPDFALEQMAEGTNLAAFGGLDDLEPATESTTGPATRPVADASPLTTSPNQLQENPEMPIRRGQENENDLFDWEREELPDYLQAFLLDEAEIEQSGLSSGSPSITDVNTPPARIRSREDTSPNNLGDLPPWLIPEEAATPPAPPPPPANSVENEGTDDAGNIDRLGLMTSALPSWLDTPTPGYNPPPPPANLGSLEGNDFDNLAPFNLEEGNDFGEPASPPLPPPPPFRPKPATNQFNTPAANLDFGGDIEPFSLDDDNDLTGFEPPAPPLPPRPLVDRSKETRPNTRNFGDFSPPTPPTPAPAPAFDLGLDMNDLKPFSFEEFDAAIPPPPPPATQFQAPSGSGQTNYAPSPPPPTFAGQDDFGDLLPFNLDDSDMAAPPPPPPGRTTSFADQFRQPPPPAGFEGAGMDTIQPFSMDDFDVLPPSPPPPPAWQGSSRPPSAYNPPPPHNPAAQPDFDMEPFNWNAEGDNIFGVQEAELPNPFQALNQTAYKAPPAQPEPEALGSDEEKPLRQFEWVRQRTPEPEKAGEATSLFDRLAARRKQQEATQSFQPVSRPAPTAPVEVTEEDLLPLEELERRASQPAPSPEPAPAVQPEPATPPEPLTPTIEAETFQPEPVQLAQAEPEPVQATEQTDMDDFGELPVPDSADSEPEPEAATPAPVGITEPLNLRETGAVQAELKSVPLTAALPPLENAEPEWAEPVAPTTLPIEEVSQPEPVAVASPADSDEAVESAAPEPEQEATPAEEEPIQEAQAEPEVAIESAAPAQEAPEQEAQAIPAEPEEAAVESAAPATSTEPEPEQIAQAEPEQPEPEEAAVESLAPEQAAQEEPETEQAAVESPAPAAPVQTAPEAAPAEAPEAAIEAAPPVAQPAAPAPSEENLRKAYQFFDQQDYNQSLNFFNQAVKVADKAVLPEIVSKLREIVNSAESSPRFHRVLGDAYKKQGQFQAALAEYSKALAPASGKK